MVKSNSNHKSSFRRRPFLIVLLILLIAIAGLFVARLISRTSIDNEVKLESSENSFSNTTTSDTEEIKSDDEKPEIIQNEGEDPNTLENLTGSITTARVSGQKVVIRVNLDQYLSSGTCFLIMTNNEKTYSGTANIIDSASTSTCEGFDILVSDLSSGTWSISISLSSGNKTGNISGEVSI